MSMLYASIHSIRYWYPRQHFGHFYGVCHGLLDWSLISTYLKAGGFIFMDATRCERAPQVDIHILPGQILCPR